MVSTRSQSRLSESSLLTCQGNGDVGGEVSSKPATTPRTACRPRPRAAAPLEAIAEEPQPRSGGRKKKADAAATVDDSLVDRVAESMFAALGDVFGSDAEASGSSSDEEEEAGAGPSGGNGELDIRPGSLHWRPGLRLPGAARAASAGPSGRGADGDLLAEKKSGGAQLTKSLHVPPADDRRAARAARKAAPDTAGTSWFDLPATAITDEVKNDLRMLRLRSAYDPKTFYKKFDSTKFPKYFQFGTVVEGPTEFFSSRLARKDRKRTLTEEVMADPHLTAVRKKRYAKMQAEAAAQAPRGGRKTGNLRAVKKARRPKH